MRRSGRVAALCAVLVAAIQATLPPVAAQPAPPGASLEQRLLDATGGRARVVRHEANGRLRFVGTDRAHPLPRAQGLRSDASPEAAARGFLKTYGSLFGADDQSRQLRVRRTAPADAGRSNVRFQQVHGGVPVLAGELAVNLDRDGNILSANGELSPDLRVDTGPVITATDAGTSAVVAIAKGAGVEPDQLKASDPELWIFDPVLLGAPQTRPPSLVWRTEVTAPTAEPRRELVLVDATTGAIALHFDQVKHAETRRICDRNNSTLGLESCTAPYTRSEGQAETGIPDVDDVYTFSGDVYDYFFDNFGRDSLDGAGMPLVSTVRFCRMSSACPYKNAFWNGLQMVFGQGFYSDDVVGHEFTHGVTEHESGLLYYYQSGAIDESLSDVFGELIDLGNALGTDSAGVRWIVGEDLGTGTLRDMRNPPAYGDPDAMDSPYYTTSSSDHGGVHTNSGVNNKAAFLMTDGGTFNGISVTGLGVTKVGHVYYEANANLLTSGSDYQDLYVILNQACLNKVGTAGITTDDCTQVENAAKATKMNLTAPGTAPEAPVCSAGQTKTDLFFDDMENPASGNWDFGGTGAGGWHYATGYAVSGIRDLYGPEPTIPSDRTAARASAVIPPAGKATYLRFSHSFDLEEDYDGGLVEYSTDNGSSWTDARALFVDNGYNWTNAEAPLAGRQVFSNASRGYISSRLNLSPLAGQSVRFQFRLVTDQGVAYDGWDIDDVRVYTCEGRSGGGGKVADFDGSGTTDIAVFRPAAGAWFVRNGSTVSLGAAGDIPVPGDYDGDGRTEVAVFRPSVGGWYRPGVAPVFFGVNGDIPVPGDYDGDGTTDIAVFRPSVGGWYRDGAAPVFFGLSGDIPVPADYDGNGTTDIAVYRPSVGGWYRDGAAPVFHGLNGDIPVPGDYDGNGAVDVTVYRSSVGGWYRRDAGTAFLGLATDVPQPGDYDGNGTTDLAVFRPSAGAWFVQGQGPVSFGLQGDLPLSLPAHIRAFFYP